MPKASGLGHRGDHGGLYPGQITSAGTKLKVEGVQISIVGDSYICSHPDHTGVQQLTSTGASTKVKINGQAVACEGTQTTCGAVIRQHVNKLTV